MTTKKKKPSPIEAINAIMKSLPPAYEAALVVRTPEGVSCSFANTDGIDRLGLCDFMKLKINADILRGIHGMERTK